LSVKLSVNLNAVAMLRNRRDLPWPSVTHIGLLALQAGADGITVHPRPDQRHIRFSDLPDLRRLTKEQSVEFNVEGYPSEEFLQLVKSHRPDQVTLVPDDPQQNTSDHGWDFEAHREYLTEIVRELHNYVLRVSLFCDPDASETAVLAAKTIGADRLEIYTGPYGATYGNPQAAELELKKIARTASMASELGLGINAGHDLTVANLPGLVRAAPRLLEVSIGHALIGEAIEFGIAEAVRRFQKAAKVSS
jgi:pyridoxine 5-phosphate synthase